MTPRAALRSLYRDKSFVFNAVLLLALGIGVNLAFFAVLNANLARRPPHVFEPHNVFELSFDQISFSGTRIRQDRTSYPLFERVREVLRGTAEVACEYRALVGFGQGESSQEVQAALVSESYFDLLGVKPMRGRPFSSEEHKGNAQGGGVAILDYDFWKQTHRDEGGPEILIADQPHSVIGILPDGFRGVAHRPSELWLPLKPAVALAYPFERSAFELISDPEERLVQIILRPVGNHSPQHIKSILVGSLVEPKSSTPIGVEILDVHLEVNGSNRLAGFSGRMLRWGSLMALLTLLVASANVATLGLFRGLRCSRRTLVQFQLGATAGRILRLALSESLALSILATVVALGLFAGIVAALENSLQLPPLSVADLLSGETLTLLFVAVLIAVSAAGIPMGIQAMRLGWPPTHQRMRLPAFRESGQMGAFLVFIQVAAATCLLAQSGLFYASIRDAVDGLGFGADNLVMVEMPNLRKLGHSEASIQQLFDRLEEQARYLPGTVSTGRATAGPFRKFQVTSVRGPDQQLPKLREGVYVTAISPGYIPAMDMTLTAGRNLIPEDSWGSESAAILNERLARLIWADKDPIGDCLYISRDPQCTRVVGVLKDSRLETSIFAKPKLQCYLALKENGGDGLDKAGEYLFVRVADGGAAKTIQQLKAVPETPSYVYATVVDEFVQDEMRSMTVGFLILGLLGLVAVAVSTLGIFAQLAFWVRSRKRELGVRMALGARPLRIVRTVLCQSALPLSMGLFVGLLASIPLSNLARSYIFGLSSITLSSMVAISALVFLAGALASAMPCIRALKVDPIETLRTE